MQGLDPVSQSQIAARQAQADLAQRQEERLSEQSQINSALSRLKGFGAIARVIKDLPEDQQREFLEDTVDIHGRDPGSITSEDLVNLSNLHGAIGSSDMQMNRLALDTARLNLQIEQEQNDQRREALDRKLKEKQLELSQMTEARQSRKLSAASEKALIESQDSYNKNIQDSRQYELLAADFQRLNPEGGVFASFDEFAAQVLGSQDEVNELRRRFNKIRINEGLKNLPPGPATDKDVQLALQGVPPSGASVEQVTSFLRGAAKASNVAARYEEFKSNYISDKGNTRGLITAWKEEAKNITFETPTARYDFSGYRERLSPVMQSMWDTLPEEEKIKVLESNR